MAYGPGAGVLALRDVDLDVAPGTAVGLVGESGSGKSTLALAALRFLPGDGRVVRGRVELGGVALDGLSSAALRDLWRRRVRLVPQDPLASLNPSLTVGRQVAEGLAGDPAGRDGEGTAGASPRGDRARDAVRALLASVGLADAARVAASYPHQLSGGMQQRVAIAMALGGAPELLVMDEPTTNLDVTTEATVLDLVRDLRERHGTAVLYVSHSLAVVARTCDRVAVLYAGELVEDAPVAELYRRPLHPYTRGLLDSLPRVGQDRRAEPLRPIEGRIPEAHARPPGCVFADRCPVAIERCHAERPALDDAAPGRRVRCHRWPEIAAGTLDPRRPAEPPARAHDALAPDGDAPALSVRSLSKRYPLARGAWAALRRRPARAVRALEDASLEVWRGRTLGLVGESGSGKSTLARCVVGLTVPTAGEVALAGARLAPRLEHRYRARLGELQMVFQNSGEALNPYLTVGESLARPLRRLAGARSGGEIEARVRSLLEAVHLPAAFAARVPGELSGGEQQRVAIARALATEPCVLVFDESVSGLDVSVQAGILDLLTRLQDERHGAYAFISHDLAVVAYLADDIAVMHLGRVVESGPASAVLRPPYHPYTEALLSAVPTLDPDGQAERVRLTGDAPSPVDLPPGCPFHTRCPRSLGELCEREAPPWRRDASGKTVACHIPLEELVTAQVPLFADAGDAGAGPAAEGAAP
ncbi:MAG: ABC transporter ATP-binding protein [Trueperaceae bacterium]|nr:ABC transporter ATP-binding protein [Trueperaceae bacterium]